MIRSPSALTGRLAEDRMIQPSTPMLRVLVVSSVFPTAAHPSYGVFVRERVRAIAELPGLDVRVIAPTPYVPPLKGLQNRYIWGDFPREETIGGLRVVRPRFPMLPKVGGYVSAEAMYPGLLSAAKTLYRENAFDLIDAHFAYPAGVAAEWLGRHFSVPVVITGRGEDMHRFPKLPWIGKRIRKALSQPVRCIALSEEIEHSFLSNGADPARITRIPNGIDDAKFYAIPRDLARSRLGLPLDRPIVVSVGNLQELKGFHLLVEAVRDVRRRFDNVLLILVGDSAPYGSDFRNVITGQIRVGGLEDHVRLVGRRPHDELRYWYSAADVFSLLSSREGSPNVLLEALSCGTPAVATSVGGMREELSDPALGILLPERTAAAAATAIGEALERSWDRPAIASQMRLRTWGHVAAQVRRVFESAVDEFRLETRSNRAHAAVAAAIDREVCHARH